MISIHPRTTTTAAAAVEINESDTVQVQVQQVDLDPRLSSSPVVSSLPSQEQEHLVPTVVRHYDLWFDDGSIVLRAQNPITLFRVHRAILARHSEVFRHMFAIPQPLVDQQEQQRQRQTRPNRGLSSSARHRIVKQRASKSVSVDFVKEPTSEIKMMGSLSRRLLSSALGVKSDSTGSFGNNEEENVEEFDKDDDQQADDEAAAADGDRDDENVPVDEATAEVIEGCAVVDMHDSSRDVASLLHALYDGPQWTDNSPSDFAVVSGVLRLAHKYLIDNLRTKALEHLHQAWPTTLQGWDVREDLIRGWSGSVVGSKGLEREWSPAAVVGVPSEGRFPHPIRVINLARSVNAHSLLPSAFYDLSRLTFSQIFEGMAQTHPSSSAPAFSYSSDPSLSLSDGGGDSASAMTTLSLSDFQKLSVGKEQGHQAITSLITNLGNVRCSITGGGGGSGVKMWCCAFGHHNNNNNHIGGGSSMSGGGLSGHHHHHYSSSHSSVFALAPSSISRKSHHYHTHSHSACHSPVSCRKDFTELVELATQHYLFDREKGHTDPLYVADELGQLKSAEYSECKACSVALECWSMRERERMWRSLPGWFRIGSGWDALV